MFEEFPGSCRGSSSSSSESIDLCFLAFGGSTRLLVSNSFLSVFVVVDPVFVSLLVLEVTLSGRSRDSVDPRLLNLHLLPATMNVEVFAHARSRSLVSS